jgi:hypothetical protein
MWCDDTQRCITGSKQKTSQLRKQFLARANQPLGFLEKLTVAHVFKTLT